jgi:co-chaperonin GroES (HSP10)
MSSAKEVPFVAPEKAVELEFTPPRAILWRMVIEPFEPPNMTAGGIALAEEALETERLLTNVGKVVNMGPLCYRGKTTSGLVMEDDDNPKVGDWVIYGTYGGQKVKTKSGRVFIVINDDNILGVVESPEHYQYHL